MMVDSRLADCAEIFTIDSASYRFKEVRVLYATLTD